MRRFAGFLPVLLASFALLPALALASPGAHGPNGEHLDGPAAGAAAGAGDGRPRMEAYTELFEMVAHLETDAVTAMINRYETNEPIDGAEVELEAGDRKVKASFDAQTGVYRFADKALTASLSAAGEHALVFTVAAGEDIDLVTGTLRVAADAHAHGAPWWRIALGTLAALAALALVFHFLRRRSSAPRIAGARP